MSEFNLKNATLSDLFPSKYLKSEQLEKDEDLVLTISDVTVEAVGQDQEQKAVVWFEEIDEGLVLNKTNANTIAQNADSAKLTDWIGMKVKLFKKQVEFQGKQLWGIRVKLD